MTEEEQPIISKRIFINNVDCYQGNNIAKVTNIYIRL